MDLFSSEKQEFQVPDAELIYIPNLFSINKSNSYFNKLKTDIEWKQDKITVYGKTYMQPRLTALYGETNQPYSYSNITMYPKPFSKDLLDIKTNIEAVTANLFNTVLLNLYRDGNDSNGWHADNEKGLGEDPIIASLSFGESRPFHFKHKTLKNERHKLLLEHGSLLIMRGAMQQHWLHQIAKTKKQIGERINLTFRTLI
jgi:alkylated DNA repair dioxygenase AlkB